MENAEELKELKARLLAVVAGYKKFNAPDIAEAELIVPKAEGNHYFDLNGNFLGTDEIKGQQEIRILSVEIELQNFRKSPFTVFNNTAMKYEAIAKICNFYIADKTQGLGFNITYLEGDSVTICNDVESLYNGIVIYPSALRTSGEMAAWTAGKSKFLLIPVDGKIIRARAAHNYIDLMNSMVHEIHHLQKDKGISSDELDDVTHLQAYFTQFNHETFANSTQGHRERALCEVASMLVQIKLYALVLKNRPDLEEAYQTNKKFFERKYKIKFANIDARIQGEIEFYKYPPIGNNTTIKPVGVGSFKIEFLK